MAPPPNHLIYTGNIYLHMPATVALAFSFDNILTDEKYQQPWMFFLFFFCFREAKVYFAGAYLPGKKLNR